MAAREAIASADSTETWWLYVLECQGGVLYTGIAKDVDARFEAHVKGTGAIFTRLNRPVRILGKATTETRGEALRGIRIQAGVSRRQAAVVRHGAGEVRGEESPLNGASGIRQVDFLADLAKLPRASRPTHYHRVMPIQYPPVGSKWKELDFRVVRTVQVVRYDLSKRRVRIACLETDKLTWAKVERFNGKSKGYGLVSAVAKRSKRR